MATPHGHTPRNLNTGFIESSTPEAFQDVQLGSPKSYTLEFNDALGNTSSAFHSSLEPSILSIFENSSADEAEIQVDVESEASLLSAFSEMLDSVIEDTLSPFDTLPDSKLFTSQMCQDSRQVRFHCLDREAAPRITRSLTPSNLKAEGLHSDRQLRPRLHRRTQTATVQRSDGEDEDLRETRRRPVQIFRSESDPVCEDKQQDGFLSVSLVELVKHMHPYSLRVTMDKKEILRDVEELQNDDVFVDVVGDEDTISKPFVLQSEQIVPHPKVLATSSSVHDSSQETLLKMCLPNSRQQKDGTAKLLSSRRMKKKVRFAADVASIHIYQVEDEADSIGVSHALSSEEHTDNLKMPNGDIQPSDLCRNSGTLVAKPSQNSTAKVRTLSLQEYRVLRQKRLQKDKAKTDYRTKWPSVPETPKELPPIPCIQGYSSSLVNVKPPINTNTSTQEALARTRANPHLPLKSLSKQSSSVRKPMQAVDPPNPVTVSLQSNAKLLLPLSKEPKLGRHDGRSQANRTSRNPPAAVQPVTMTQHQPLIASSKDSQANCSPTISGIDKPRMSVPSLPVAMLPVHRSQGSLPQVQTPVTSHLSEEKQQKSAKEIGIEATDVTSLLEQFETQGLTPPATPPHQMWNPLTTQKAKQHEATKPSPSKTIQIIEPKPLPPSKIQTKPQPSSSIPAPSLFLAFIDHDYCGTQDLRLGKKRALSDVYMHNSSHKESRNHTSHTPIDNRTSCEAERLSGSVFLSPETSPRWVETKRAGEPADADTGERSRCSCSPSPPARGRTRRRHRHYESSSVSSSRSSSCSSSASSCSPPRKRPHRSESSSSLSSRSSSQSLSPAPIRGRRWRYARPQSRSFSRSRSRSFSPQPDWRQKWSSRKRQREYRGEDARREARQKAIEERRVVYVGRIRGSITNDELRERFALFGNIEDCTVHFRSPGDNYGFVTYYNKDDAFTAIEKGKKLRQQDELPFDICFGGRRQFCQSNYMDLDSKHDMNPAPSSNDNALDFDALLKQAQQGLKT